MEKRITPTKAWITFTQIFDSSFPSGSFVHSFGLESHVLSQKVTTKEELREFLEDLVYYKFIPFEFVQIKKIFSLLEKNCIKEIKTQDEEFSAFLTYEYAKASKDMSKSYRLQLKDFVSEYDFDMNDITLLSIVAYKSGFLWEDFALFWAKKTLLNIASTILKISRIKPSEIQQIVFGLDDMLAKIEFQNIKNELGNFNPLFEEVIFSHKNLEPKMFMT